MQTDYGVQTDQGRIRLNNEDSYVTDPEHSLFVVADGMGGHAAGEVASRIASETVLQSVRESTQTSENIDGDIEDILRRAVHDANSQVHEAQRSRSEYAGMGSTLTILKINRRNYWIAHVGDSRAYLMRGGALRQLTKDHSVVWKLFESGILAKDSLSLHPQKNLITRSIGTHPRVDVDVETGGVMTGDVFLLCSDGLSDVVKEEQIQAFLSETSKTCQQICHSLVLAALDGGGPDNITAVAVRIAG
jgi:PPM family protein phosphatase